MAKEFIEKKALIIEKLRELKSNNRSIEEIYKYTNEIIVEEEDEEEEETILPAPVVVLKKKKSIKIDTDRETVISSVHGPSDVM